MRLISFFTLLLAFTHPISAGVFEFSSTSLFQPFIIVHSPGYSGSGGTLEVSICTNISSARAVPALRDAIERWNNLNPIFENCVGCRLWEEGPGSVRVPASLEATLLHEIGHCAMGIDHINCVDCLSTAAGSSSFTSSKDGTTIDVGLDAVRGSRDDLPSPLPGTRVLHWFRKMDNDPFIIDSLTVDSSTYTRRIEDLPVGDNWPASGNRAVGDLMGLANSQSIMYSGIDVALRYLGLTADDVNTVRYAMTGLDEQAGTADDYTVQLVHTFDCSSADIEIEFVPLGPDSTEFGACIADLEPFPSGLVMVHHVLVPLMNPRIVIEVNGDREWDALFYDGFESGGFSSWSAHSP